MKGRRVEAEILDSLAVDDPSASRARKDLRLLNRLMGHVPCLDHQQQ